MTRPEFSVQKEATNQWRGTAPSRPLLTPVKKLGATHIFEQHSGRLATDDATKLSHNLIQHAGRFIH